MIEIDIKVKYDNYTLPIDNKLIRNMFKEVVVEERKEVRALYVGVLSNFTAKNRSPLRHKTGSGRSPVSGAPGSVYSAIGTSRLDGPFVWLEDGTDVRYRVMSANWRSRSTPGGGIAFSGSRRGSALGFDMAGRPGIAARNFRDDIIKRRYPKFAVNADVAFTKFFRRARWIK